MKKVLAPLFWFLLALSGAAAYAVLAFRRQEPVNSADPLIAAVCTHAIGYRFYSKWITAILLLSLREWILLWSRRKPAKLCETDPVWLPDYAVAEERSLRLAGTAALALVLARE